MKSKDPSKKLPKIRLPKLFRQALIVILALIIISSTVLAINAFQQPTTTKQTYQSVRHSQTGRYSYIITLKNNTVYNKTLLLPGEGVIFKQLIDDFNISFSYNFQVNKTAEISLDYSITASIITSIWTKTYALVPEKIISKSGTSTSFKEIFLLNHSFYEDVVNTINKETGVTASNPTLNIVCTVFLTATTDEGVIVETFSPLLTVSLLGKTVEVSEELYQSTSGSLTNSKTVTVQDVYEQRNAYSITAIIFFIISIIFIFYTSNKAVALDKTKKTLKRIRKKYGDWIVESSSNPSDPSMKAVIVKTIDDLSKVGEELGKPLVSFNKDNNHEFFVVDNNLIYKYELKPEEKIKKIAICPQCKHEIPIEGYRGSQIEVTCEKCGKKGFIELNYKNQNKKLKNYFEGVFNNKK